MLSPGTRLGPYEIVELVGEGGMGQVFRAADTRLDRQVAIKVLPAALAHDPVRRERFEREARTVSRLEHPHICPLYDIGAHEGHPFIVMQFLEGETLAARLARGPLSVTHTLEYGIQIAEALAAAHAAGIVHRDLKPANVMLTKAGAHLMDFGLARQVSFGGPAAETMGASGRLASLTTDGTVLGTLHYMAPEQLEGREVDTRADVFAFGVMLFEMISGLKAFDGENPARVMSAILRDEPARVSSLVPVTPAGLDALIHTCMAKDPAERWQGLSDVARQLRWLRSSLSGGRSQPVAVPPDLTRSAGASSATRRLAMAAAGLLVFTAVGVGAYMLGARAAGGAVAPARLHAALLPPEGHYLTNGLALSPDGRQLAFVASDAGGRQQLWLRPLDGAAAMPLEGTVGASDPFWSPDGRDIAFFAAGQLRRVAAQGGNVTVICDAGAGAGGTWSADGTIVFQPHQEGVLMKVPAAGGTPQPATRLDATNRETHHLYPSFLPDGRRFVFYVEGGRRGLYVASLDADAPRSFVLDPAPSLPAGAAATPGVVDGGLLVFVRDRVLLGVPFDPATLQTAGEPRTLAETVDYDPPGRAAFATRAGVLVYRARPHLPLASLAWVARDGRNETRVDLSPGHFRELALHGDGRTLAMDRYDAQGLSSVWVSDLETGSSARVPATYWTGQPRWMPDGVSLVYASAADSPPNLVLQPRAGGALRRLTQAAAIHFPASVTPDGHTVVFRAFSPETGWDLMALDLRSDPATPQRLLQTRANEHDAQVSPDGRLVAFTSDESGRVEIYLARFPEMENRRMLSRSGGTRPMWRADGRELFYVSPQGQVMAASMAPRDGHEPPRELFRADIFRGLFVPSRDGQRFLIARPSAATTLVPMEVVVGGTG